MRAALYIRVSTEDQATEGYSIDDQKRRLTSFADSQDWDIGEVYIDDGYSAKDLNRPDIQRLIQDVQQRKIDIVLIYKLNRLVRSAADCDYLLKLFDRYDVKFQSCVESYETRTAAGRLFIRLMADIAQFERENIAENVRNGMEQMVIEGKRPGGPVPFGYMDDAIRINPDEARICRELRRLYMEEGLGFKKIAVELNKMGWLKRGNEWSTQTVWYVLDNPYYTGKIRWGTKNEKGTYTTRKKGAKMNFTISDGSQEIIFTTEEYEEHNARMQRRSFNGYTKIREYWFAGILKCAKCGSAMTGRYHQNKRSDGSYNRYLSYICGRRQSGNNCTMPMFRQELVEKLIMEYIERLKNDPRLMEQLSGTKLIDKQIEELLILQKDLGKVRERKKKWQQMFMEDDPILTEEELRSHIKEEREKEEIFIARIEALQQNELKVVTSESIQRIVVIPKMWPELDDKEKNELVQTVFRSIELDTPLERAHGKKGQFLPASIKEVVYS